MSFKFGSAPSDVVGINNKISVLSGTNPGTQIVYNTISDALAATNSGDTVTLGVGPYTEGGLVVPEGVNVSAPYGSILLGNGTDTTLTLQGSSNLIGDMNISAPPATGAAALVLSGSENVVFSNLLLSGTSNSSDLMVFASGSGYKSNIVGTPIVSGRFNNGFKVLDGHIVRSTVFSSEDGEISGSTILRVAGQDADVRINSVRMGLLEGSEADYGIVVSGSSKLSIFGGRVNDYNISSLYLESDGVDISISNSEITSERTDGLAVLVNPDLEGIGTRFHLEFVDANRTLWSEPTQFFTNANFHLIGNSDDEDANKLISWGELGIGLPERPSKSIFGGGDSYDRNILVYTSSSAGGFVDVSDIAKAPGSGTFSLPGTADTDAIYMASRLFNSVTNDYMKVPGIRFVQTVAGVTGSGRIIAEYQTGSSWSKVNMMSIQNQSNYITFPDQATFCYESVVTGSNHINFDFRLPSSRRDWTKSDPVGIGTDYYWFRFRPSGSIDTTPEFDSIRFHTNRTEINEDGFIQMFGFGRTVQRLPWDSGAIQGAVASPGNQDVYLSDTITVGRIENSFASSAPDRIGTVLPIPLDLDTSCGISFQIMWYAKAGASPGDGVKWNIRWARTRPGDAIYSSAAQAPTSNATQKVSSQLVTIPGPNVQITTTIQLDVSEFSPRRESGGEDADWLWLVIERDTDDAGDTMSEEAVLCNIRASYFAWSQGGHVTI